MRVAVVIPTVEGREQDLTRCWRAYHRTSPHARVYIIDDKPTCGEAWLAGAQKAAEHGFDYLHLTADDLEPHDGWLETAVDTVNQDRIPCPVVLMPDGSLQSAGLAGFGCYSGPYEDWQGTESTTVPFLSAEMWDRIGMVPLHYCTDMWVSAIGRKHGWETVIRTGMVFTHYNAMPGRDQERAPADAQAYLQHVREWEASSV